MMHNCPKQLKQLSYVSETIQAPEHTRNAEKEKQQYGLTPA